MIKKYAVRKKPRATFRIGNDAKRYIYLNGENTGVPASIGIEVGIRALNSAREALDREQLDEGVYGDHVIEFKVEVNDLNDLMDDHINRLEEEPENHEHDEEEQTEANGDWDTGEEDDGSDDDSDEDDDNDEDEQSDEAEEGDIVDEWDFGAGSGSSGYPSDPDDPSNDPTWEDDLFEEDEDEDEEIYELDIAEDPNELPPWLAPLVNPINNDHENFRANFNRRSLKFIVQAEKIQKLEESIKEFEAKALGKK